MKSAVVLIIIPLITINGFKIPSNFKTCNYKKNDFQKCVFEAAQHGIGQLTHPYPELNIPEINPFFISEARIDGGTGPVGVQQIFRDCNFFGLNNIRLARLDFDFDGKNLDFEGMIPEVKMLCKYEMIGRVLLLPVNGRGNSTITLTNLKVSETLQWQESRKKSKTFMKFVSSSTKLQPEKMHFNFESSVDRRLSDNINPVLNDNWKEIFDDVKGGYEEMIGRIVMNLANGFFAKVSKEEAFEN